MDIKTVGPGNSPTLSTQKPALPIHQPSSPFYPLKPLPTDEIIDYVEIQANNYHPAPSRLSSYPGRIERSNLDKGTLIDLWI